MSDKINGNGDPGAYDGSGLRAEGIVVRFGGLVALGGVTVEAPRGRITGLIGPNGAGKTTMFNVCCGFQKADEGTVTLDGKDISHESPAGQGRLVELARALARGPNLLLLDEPSSGLDAAESAEFAQLLVRLVEDRDLGILMVEHDMSLVLTICQWIHVLDFGKPLMDGTPEQVRTSEEVRAAYLGQEGAA